MSGSTIIWLKYRAKGAALGTTSAMRFDALIGENLPDSEYNQQRGLRRIDYSHMLSSRSVWDVSIGPDQLYVPAAQTFIREFWKGAQHWIAVNASLTEPTATLFNEVTTPGGRVPLQPVEGHYDFPQFIATLTAKRPD